MCGLVKMMRVDENLPESIHDRLGTPAVRRVHRIHGVGNEHPLMSVSHVSSGHESRSGKWEDVHLELLRLEHEREIEEFARSEHEL